jgi:DMSO/TMAO reductase YedYZ molybdopterin-dependent catalytic subunit
MMRGMQPLPSLPSLPPGQRERADFPRFGTTPFAKRWPSQTTSRRLEVHGAVRAPLVLDDALAGLPRVDVHCDFHCVTTWSHRGLCFGGVRWRDLYEQVIVPRAAPHDGATLVELRAQDGARTGLLLQDLLAADVLLADTLDGQPLPIEHGAPLRLVAPAHYGYKWVKHLSRVTFKTEAAGYRTAALRFMDHPRARVALEERGRGLPGWLLRRLYRPLIGPTVARFAAERPPQP